MHSTLSVIAQCPHNSMHECVCVCALMQLTVLLWLRPLWALSGLRGDCIACSKWQCQTIPALIMLFSCGCLGHMGVCAHLFAL